MKSIAPPVLLMLLLFAVSAVAQSNTDDPLLNQPSTITPIQVIKPVLLAGTCSYINTDNGIYVFTPTVYDIRDFEELESQLSSELQALKALDNQTLLTGIGATQGQSIGNETNSLSAFGTPSTPSTTGSTTGGNTSTNTNSGGGKNSNQNNNSTVNSNPSSTSPSSTGSGSPTEGVEGRFQEELALESQILNLELLLRPSLSDRLYREGNYVGEPQRVVIRFDITTAPLVQYDWDYANIEVTVKSEDKSATAPPKLIALLPEQDGSNVVNGSTVSNSLTLGPAASFVNFGLGISGGSQSQFLNKDFDVIGYQEPGPTMYALPGAESQGLQLTYVWQLRPVLGRPRIDICTRHYFAVLEVPGVSDLPSPKFDLNIRTFWRQANKQRAGDVIPTSFVTYKPVAITPPTLDQMDEFTDARITCAPTVEDIGGGRLLISGRDGSLTPQCQLIVGAQMYSSPTLALNIGVDGSFALIANAADLCTFPTVNDNTGTDSCFQLSRAGVPAVLDSHARITLVGESWKEQLNSQPLEGFKIDSVAVSKTTKPADKTKTALEISLTSRNGAAIGALIHPLVNVNNVIYGVSPNLLTSVEVDGKDANHITQYVVTVTVPTTDISASQRVVVVDPFRGAGFIDSANVPNVLPPAKPGPATAIKDVVVVSESVNHVVLAIEGAGLSKVTKVQCGTQSAFAPKDPDGDPIPVKYTQSNYNELQNVLVTYPDGRGSTTTVAVPVPAVTIPSSQNKAAITRIIAGIANVSSYR